MRAGVLAGVVVYTAADIHFTVLGCAPALISSCRDLSQCVHRAPCAAAGCEHHAAATLGPRLSLAGAEYTMCAARAYIPCQLCQVHVGGRLVRVWRV